MSRPVLALGLTLVLLAGCESRPSHPAPSQPSRPGETARSPGPSPPGSASPEAVEPSSILRLPRIVLTADLSEPPAPWHLVTAVPFGSKPEELGLVLPPENTPEPIFPPSFAVDRDGSFWILDIVKRRVVHLSARGEYLGEYGGLRFDRFHPHAWDVAFSGRRLVLLQQVPGLSGKHLVALAAEPKTLPGRLVTLRGRPLFLVRLIAGAGPVLARIAGYAGAGHIGTGPQGTVRIAYPGSAKARLLPGLPVDATTWMDVRLVRPELGDQDLIVRYVQGRERAYRPIHVRLVPAVGDEGLVAEVSVSPEAVLPHGFITFVGVGPSRNADLHYGSARYLLGLFDDGSPMIWERLPDPELKGHIRRWTTTGPGRSIYVMVPRRDGMYIYRR